MRYPQQSTQWVPDWAQQALFYHIYPLGFLDAPAQNDLKSEPVPRLADLRQWYDHLMQMGITTIYFGPLFESLSHGYDTVDYFRIDRRLGDNTLFKEIVDELHSRGIRVILDGVFHHTSRDFFAFRDILKNKRNSQYADWYHINWGGTGRLDDGFAYESWEGHYSLPKLNLQNQKVRNYIFEVVRMWLGDMGIDGWRLDVAYEIGPEFWWEFRRECKQANPDCFLVGEVVHGDYRKWVAPDLLDAGTNYQLHKAIWSSLNEANLWELKALVERASHTEWGLYKDIGLLNFLSNHDVTRILSQLDDPRLVYPALIFLLTAPGIPCLYYGDEVGMTGRKEDGDAALRQPMPAPGEPWPDTERTLFKVISDLAAIRKEHPSLTYGRYATLEVSDTAFSFMRQQSREIAVVAINAADRKTGLTMPVGREGITDGTTFHDMLDLRCPEYTVQNGKLTVDPIWPTWGRVLIANL
jgi:cyclomaltodextrinase